MDEAGEVDRVAQDADAGVEEIAEGGAAGESRPWMVKRIGQTRKMDKTAARAASRA